MIYVRFINDTLTLKIDTLTGMGEPRLVIAFPAAGTWCDVHHFVTTHEQIEPWAGVKTFCLKRLEDPTTGIVYKLVPQEETE